MAKNCQKWKKKKVVQNCLKRRENWSKTSFGLFSPPPKFLFGGRTKNFCWKWKKSNFFKIAWNGENISWKRVLVFLAPPQKKLGGVQNLFVKIEKNQSCSKLPIMARKLLKTSFGLLIPLYSKRKFVKNRGKHQRFWKLLIHFYFYFLPPPFKV